MLRTRHVTLPGSLQIANDLQSIYTLVTLDVDLSGVPNREFILEYSPSGKAYFTLAFELGILVQSAMEFSMSVNGIKYGSVTAKYH